MANIMKDDARTYVEGLIKKEFSSKNNEEKFLSDKRKTNTGEHPNMHRHPLLQSLVMEDWFQTWKNKQES